MGGATIVYVVYGRQPLGDLDGRRADGARLVRHLHLRGGRGRRSCPPDVGLRDALALAQATGRLETMDTSLDPSRPYTLWSGLVGGMFLAMAYFGCDQSQVQRYLSGRSLTESRLSLLFNALPQGPDAVPDPAHRGPRLRLLPLPRDAAAVEPRRAGAARAQAPPAELARVRERGRRRAPRARTAAAEAFADARRSAGDDVAAARRRYLAAQAGVDAAEADTRRLASSVAGGPSTTSTTSSRATSCRGCAAASRA